MHANIDLTALRNIRDAQVLSEVTDRVLQILRHHDIKVVLISPGAVDTPIIKGPLEAMIDRKKCLTPDDIAQAAMLCLTLAPQSVPMEMTLDTTQSAVKS